MVDEEIPMTPETEQYLKTGAHIGTRFKSGDMKRFIYKQRKDGLKVLDVQALDERIQLAINFLSKYSPEEIVVVARKVYSQTPVKMFAEAIGARAITGRFVPGTFTNPQAKEFVEPGVIIVGETDSDSQAIKEATVVHVPVLGLASTNNTLNNIDLVIPVNNKGRRSLALIFWSLAKGYMIKREIIKNEAEFTKKIDDFEHKILEKPEEKPRFERRPRKRGGRGRR